LSQSGTTVDAACDCGVPYMPARTRNESPARPIESRICNPYATWPKMEFKIFVWRSNDALSGSVFAVTDNAKPVEVPMLSDRGNWAYFNTVNERDFRDAAAAKKSIAEIGYYIT
jgi:hypothetical protein